MAVVLVLVMAPIGDAMGQAVRPAVVCENCGHAIALMKASENLTVEVLPQYILSGSEPQLWQAMLMSGDVTSWGYSLNGLMIEFAGKREVIGIKTLIAAGADIEARGIFR